jgi:hypothetical protein
LLILDTNWVLNSLQPRRIRIPKPKSNLINKGKSKRLLLREFSKKYAATRTS